jgi:uncharacterized iron-regulated protein
MKDLDQKLAQAQIILLGETHTNPHHHRIQLDLLKDFTRVNQTETILGVEWLDASAQAACDRLSSGKITVEEFAQKVDWPHTWGFPLELYKPILEYVREKRLTLVALNAPTGVIKKIAQKGFKSLSPDERALIAPSLDLNDPLYRKQLTFQFTPHGIKDSMAGDSFINAQIARDETMAENLARHLLPWPQAETKAVIMAGSGHMSRGLGLKPRLLRRLPGAKILTVIPVSQKAMAAMGDQMEKLADLVVVSEPTPRHKPRLGLFLKPEDKGLLVMQVMPQSPAEKAGIKAGDILLDIDGHAIKEVMDIHRLIKKNPQKKREYNFLRQGSSFTTNLSLTGKDK